jgi:hypothetical protein
MITKMKMLNDILSQKKITPEFENSLLTKYSEVFKENQNTDDRYVWKHMQTRDFIRYTGQSLLHGTPGC